MNRIMIIFSILSLFSCKIADNKLRIETVMGQYIKASKTTENGAHVRYTTRKLAKPLVEPKIDSITLIKNELAYTIQGHINSGGHTIAQVANIRTKKEFQNDTVFIIHYVEIKNKPGKEGANIMGYNYSQRFQHNLKSGIRKVNIELIHHYVSRNERRLLTTEQIEI